MKTVEKIFKSLTNDLNKLYKNYIYLGLTNEEYESICLEAINRNNNPELSMPQISERVIGNIDKRLKKLLLNTLTNYEDNKDIVLGYVDFALKKNKNFFNSFDKLVNKTDINMIGLLEFLLSNSDTFYKEIEKNYNNNKEMIKAGKTSIIFSNTSLINSIELYCCMNNIEIKKDFEVNYEKLGSDSSSKMLIKEIVNKPVLTHEQEVELFKKIELGDEAAKKLMIECNLRLVLSVAVKHHARKLEFMDLFDEGVLGLHRAIEKFDYRRNLKFSTYAVIWINQAIYRAIENKDRSVRLPICCQNKLSRYLKKQKELTLLYNREPSVEEVARSLGMALKEAYELDKLQYDTDSLNSYVDDEDGAEKGDFVASDNPLPDEVVMNSSLLNELKKVFNDSGLSDREQKVLQCRFGLETGIPMTLKKTSEIFGVTMERIRQIEAKAIKDIRTNKAAKSLAYFFKDSDSALKKLDQIKRDYYSTSKKNTKEPGKTNDGTIFYYFNGYDKEKVIEALSMLPELEQSVIKRIFGDDYLAKRVNPFNKEDNYIFFYKVLPKTRRLLTKLTTGTMNMDKTIYKLLKDYDRDLIDYTITLLNEDEKKAIRKRYGDDLDHPIKQPIEGTVKSFFYNIVIPKMKAIMDQIINPSDTIINISMANNITDEDYKNSLEFIKTDIYANMIKILSPRDAMIISLRYGYISDKRFTTSAIAMFLKITEEEVKEVIKNSSVIHRVIYANEVFKNNNQNDEYKKALS